MDYATAMTDWLACAVGGNREVAARAARGLGGGLFERVAAVGTAGHVLDFDDTYLPGLAHLSAPTAPAALVLGAELDRSVGDVLDAYAAGFEAMGQLAAAAHPALYEGGWHPTAVCGAAGAAAAAAHLLELDGEQRDSAVGLALLQAGGLRAAFGSDGKALQVGLAAATGVQAARLAAAGASVPLKRAAEGFGSAFESDLPTGEPEQAIEQNWIKQWPCCLQAQGPIEAAERASHEGLEPAGDVSVLVHPVSLRAAWFGPDVATGLEAKFSIPYLVAFTLLRGPPSVDDLRSVDGEAREHAARVAVRADPSLLESEARLSADGHELRVQASLGSPGRPLGEEALAEKVRRLAGDRLEGVLDGRDRPAREVVEVAAL
jgi:2-methylcitrate dehydratase PrpD